MAASGLPVPASLASLSASTGLDWTARIKRSLSEENLASSETADVGAICTEEEEEDSGRLFFSVEQVKFLIAAVKERFAKFSDPRSVKKKIWTEIAEQISSEFATPFSFSQCDVKFRTLRNRYKKVQINRKSGQGQQTCVFYDELHELFSGAQAAEPLQSLATASPVGSSRAADDGLSSDGERTEDNTEDFFGAEPADDQPAAKRPRLASSSYSSGRQAQMPADADVLSHLEAVSSQMEAGANRRLRAAIAAADRRSGQLLNALESLEKNNKTFQDQVLHIFQTIANKL